MKSRFIYSVVSLCVLITLSITGCGGGDGKTGSTGTGLLPASADLSIGGPLVAVGPAGVSRTTFTDTTAQIAVNSLANRSDSELKLGMFVDATGSIPAGGAQGAAATVVAQSRVLGPVNTVNAAGNRMTVLSLTVLVDQNTIYENLSSLADLSAGRRVEVYGLPFADEAQILATRIIARTDTTGTVELLGAATGVSATQLSVQGVKVASPVGAVIVPSPSPSPVPPSATSVTENARVRVIGTYNAGANSIAPVQIFLMPAPVRNENSVVVLDGLVQQIIVPGQRFRVNDTEVQSTDPTAVQLTLGTRVQVRGTKTNGTLVATEFKLIPANGHIDYVVQGAVSDFVSSANFKVHGETINASTATFINGGVANLANGRMVRIVATAGPGALRASEVNFQ